MSRYCCSIPVFKRAFWLAGGCALLLIVGCQPEPEVEEICAECLLQATEGGSPFTVK